MRQAELFDPPQVAFRFRNLEIDDQRVTTDALQGSHDGTRLVLVKLLVPDARITGAAADKQNFVVRFDDEQGETTVAAFEVIGDPRRLLAAIQFGLSRRQFARRLEEVARHGDARRARETICPYCRAKLLTVEDEPVAPQVWCEYCDSLITTVPVENLGDSERDYRLCPQCGLYSRPRKFTIAYFYFLIFHAGVHHDVVYRCSGCMRPTVWRMVLGNLPGVLGMPLALTQWTRVYRDSTGRGPLRGLDAANRMLRRRRRIEKALDRYDRILERHPYSAGVLYNVAQGLIARGDMNHARQTLAMAVENCANYAPALWHLAKFKASDPESG